MIEAVKDPCGVPLPQDFGLGKLWLNFVGPQFLIVKL